MTPKEAQALERAANGERARRRDNDLADWLEDYSRRFPRPSCAVNVTAPGA